MAVFDIEMTDLAVQELKELRVFDQRRIVNAIREQLAHEPTALTRNRKRLHSVIPEFEHAIPVWELRVGDHRVFYDVDGDRRIVFVRAVRSKGPEQMTKDIIQ